MVPKTASPGRTGKTFGSYELICKLSESESGTMWAARPDDEDDADATVALRIVDESSTIGAEQQQELTAIARATEGLQHECLVPITEIVRADDKLGIVSEYVEGETLGALLRVASVRRAAMPVPVGLSVALDMLEGLAFAHSEAPSLGDASESVYGGVGPASVMVGADGRARLLELGFAGAAARVDPWSRDPKRVAYASPEALADEPSLDERSDVFSAGVFLWEMLQNKRLFGGLSYAAVSKKVREQKIPRVDDGRAPGSDEVSSAVADVVERALARDPAERFESVQDMADELRQAGDDVADREQVAKTVDKLAGRTMSSNRNTIVRAATGTPSIPPPAPRGPSRATPTPSPAKKDLAAKTEKKGGPPKPPPKLKRQEPSAAEKSGAFSKPLLPRPLAGGGKPKGGKPKGGKPGLPPKKAKPPKPAAAEPTEELDMDVDLQPHVSEPPEPPSDEAATVEREIDQRSPESDEEPEPSTVPTEELADAGDDEDDDPSEEQDVPDSDPDTERVEDESEDDDEDDDEDSSEEELAAEADDSLDESSEAPTTARSSTDEDVDDAPPSSDRQAALAGTAAAPDSYELAEGQQRKKRLMLYGVAVVVVGAIVIGLATSGDGPAESASTTTPREGHPARTAEPAPTPTPTDSSTEDPSTSDTDSTSTADEEATTPPTAVATVAPPPTKPAAPTQPRPKAPSKPAKPADPSRYIPGDL